MIKKWSLEEIELLKKIYSNEDINNIYNIFYYRTKNSILQKANKLGLKKMNKNRDKSRKYFCNFDYFNNIDTYNKAYYLGWAISDGNVFETKYRLRLHIKDLEVLNNFSRDINSTYKIYKRNDYCEIDITNKSFTDGLKKHNCIERKTFTIKFPNINDKFIFDFIKGVFDGDGSYVFTNKTKKINLVSGSKNFINSLKNILLENQIKSCIYKRINCYCLEISSKKSKKNFLNILLNTKSDFLTRKKEKMVHLFNYSIS